MNYAGGGFSEHGRTQLPGFVAFLQGLSDGDATSAVMVGEEELGASPPGCGGDTWGVPCPAASPGAQLWPLGISLLSGQPSLGRLLFTSNEVSEQGFRDQPLNL